MSEANNGLKPFDYLLGLASQGEGIGVKANIKSGFLQRKNQGRWAWERHLFCFALVSV